MFFKKIYDLYWFKFSKIRSYIVEILWFDIKRNINTDARFDYKEDVGWSKQSKFGNRGTASWTKSIKISLRELKSYIREDYCNYQFIDLGCGRGKPCIVYCEMQKKNKFKSLYTPLGIDYSFNSLKIADKNSNILFKKNNYKYKPKFIHDEVANFEEYIKSEKLIFYMYNPFDKEIMIQLKNLFLRYNCFIIYNNPVNKKLFENSNWECIYKKDGKLSQQRIRIYKNADF